MPRKRGRQFQFFVSDLEMERILAKVTTSKLKQSDYIRRAALDKEIIVIDGIREMLVQTKKIGVNLNQITKLAHQQGTQNLSAEMERINKELSEVWQLLKRALQSRPRG